MKKTSIKIKEDLALRLNRLKYTWQLKSLDAVIRKLIEICSKIETAHSFSTNKNSSAGNSPLFTLPPKSTKNGILDTSGTDSASTSHAQLNKTKEEKR